MKNIQWLIKAPFYLHLLKHHCPDCQCVLKVVKSSKVVTAGSHEAEELGLDYSMVGGVYQSGKIKVVWEELECPQCRRRISVE